ncbi:predicted protein [Histoplasma capsulatum G186AR]|uniref:Uncharacterized protein n=1 Tax=Ajellomyces capsulatus (strain G186AR / H82 / ATCC MYA-2454 / RMSCC 2432) TaxID=447093 RepID=C0NAB6_AJECG|nr:uncharacterized protein HCBG_00062 [Histoplasma capsulatum G186AR]EEH10607.1 predicted protein [Histoplasma capsulatum G186AR]
MAKNSDQNYLTHSLNDGLKPGMNMEVGCFEYQGLDLDPHTKRDQIDQGSRKDACIGDDAAWEVRRHTHKLINMKNQTKDKQSSGDFSSKYWSAPPRPLDFSIIRRLSITIEQANSKKAIPERRLERWEFGEISRRWWHRRPLEPGHVLVLESVTEYRVVFLAIRLGPWSEILSLLDQRHGWFSQSSPFFLLQKHKHKLTVDPCSDVHQHYLTKIFALDARCQLMHGSPIFSWSIRSRRRGLFSWSGFLRPHRHASRN